MIDRDDQEPADAAPARFEPFLNLPGVIVAAMAVCVGVHLVRVYGLTTSQDIELLVRAAFIPFRYSGGFDLDVYAFTSPVTYSLLHGSFAHLAINMVWLAAFGSPLASRLGLVRFVLFWAATSAVAAGLHFALHSMEDVPLIGASGAISGMMGAAARFAFRVDRSSRLPSFAGPVLPVFLVLRLRGVLIFLGIWLAINLLTGILGNGSGTDGIAWEAHIGGFLTGFLGIALFDRAPQAPRGQTQSQA